MPGNLRVQEREPGHAVRPRQREQPRQARACIMGDDREAVYVEPVRQFRQSGGLGGEGQVGTSVPAAGAEPGQIDHDAGEIQRQARQQIAPGEAMSRIAVHQQDRRAGTERPHDHVGSAKAMAVLACSGEQAGARRHAAHIRPICALFNDRLPPNTARW